MVRKVYPSTVLEIARGEIGYREKASNAQLDDKLANAGSGNWTKYGRDLKAAGAYGDRSKNGYAWCDQFVDWLFYVACGRDLERAEAMICQSGPYGAGVDWSKDYFKRQGRCDRNPRPGDQVFFGKNGGDHTGILETVGGDRLYVIEGNKDNRVKRCPYSLGDPYIDSFGHPFYDPEPDEQEHGQRYDTLDQVPGYAQETIRKLLERGVLRGRDASHLDLSDDMTRILVILDRAKIF